MATYEEVKDVPNNPEKYLIDVRSENEINNTGVIPASINIPLDEIETAFKLSDNEFKEKFNRDKPKPESALIFSCHAGGRAQRATNWALSHGFNNVKAYKGSWTEWSNKEGL